MPINVMLCHDYGGWLPLFLDEIGPTRAEDWPMLSADLISRLEAYNAWCVATSTSKNPVQRRRETRWWEEEVSALVVSLQDELGDEYLVTF